jgi:hypothetical protein
MFAYVRKFVCVCLCVCVCVCVCVCARAYDRIVLGHHFLASHVHMRRKQTKL